MKIPDFRPLTLACATAMAFAAGPVFAAEADAAKQRELEAARTQLQQAARRVAELSRELGDNHVAPMILEHRFSRKPVIGVVMTPSSESGALITAVTPDSAAAKAGLRAGDRLASVNGRTVTGSDGTERLANARVLLSGLSVDQPVTIGYVRNGESKSTKVTPQMSERVMVLHNPDGSEAILGGNVRMRQGEAGELSFNADSIEVHRMPAIAPEVRTEVIRLSREACQDGKCVAPALMEAFRWNGLNLASVDKALGRYFGTDSGVLVLSTGPELEGLQAGDVIRKVDGKTVTSPREAMDALRGKDSGSKVTIEYLRDRKSASAQVTVPRPRVLNLPPAPPAPPAPPKPPKAPPAPPAPPPVAVI